MYTYNDGVDSAGGTFSLTFEGGTTAPIAWNASSASLEEALESVSQVGDVEVVTDSINVAEGPRTSVSAWLVEFTTSGSPANVGNLPLMNADGSFLTGTSIGIHVEEVVAGCCAVELSANGGADYSGTTTVAFRFQDRAVVQAVIPSGGPASGGTSLILLGTGFDLPSSAISGEDHGLACVFGRRLSSPAVRVNSTAISCTSPPQPRRDADRMSVTVRWSGSVVPSRTAAVFTYFEDVTLRELTPRRGSAIGGYSTVVSLGRGSFAAMGIDVACSIETQLPSNLTSGYVAQTFTSPARKLLDTPGSPLDEILRERLLRSEAYTCEMPGLQHFFESEADAWPTRDWGAISIVRLTGNGGTDMTDPLIFTYVPKPTTLAVEPRQGTSRGGIRITVLGTGFNPPQGGFDDFELLCRLGQASPVPARYISNSAIDCTSSGHTITPAIISVTLESAHVFHAVQEVLLRIPSPTASQRQAFSWIGHYSVSGTWTVSLGEYESSPLRANFTEAELVVALSALPNILNVTVTVQRASISDPRTGLTWNETASTVRFISRGGDVPVLEVKTSNLLLTPSSWNIATVGKPVLDYNFAPSLVLSPEVLVRTIAGGHDGADVVREVQLLRTNRSALSSETQTVTLTTTDVPRPEVSFSGV